MDQTKLFQLRTALLWESAYGCMITRRFIIQWSQKILIIDIIISWKLLWDQRPQTIRILHEWNTETPHFQSKSVLVPEWLTCSREDKLPNGLIQITRIDQTLPILRTYTKVVMVTRAKGGIIRHRDVKVMFDNMASNSGLNVLTKNHNLKICSMLCDVVVHPRACLPVLWSCDWPSYIPLG